MSQNLAVFLTVITFLNLLFNINLNLMQWRLIRAKSNLVERKSALLDRKEQGNANPS